MPILPVNLREVFPESDELELYDERPVVCECDACGMEIRRGDRAYLVNCGRVILCRDCYMDAEPQEMEE